MRRVIQHGGGVWSIPVPIPDNPLGHTLVHLLDTGRGPVLIDTGWDDPDAYDALARGLAQAGAEITAVHGVVVTHHHPDHHGLSGRVREASGAWIAMHPADTAIVRRLHDRTPDAWTRYLADKLTAAGAPPEHVAPLHAARSSGIPGGTPALPDRDIVPGEPLDLPGHRLRPVWTPGHTPGHVCLYDERTRRLFSGDHLLPEITPHIGLYETPESATETDPLGDYLDALERVGRLDIAEVLPAHQHAFAGAADRVRQLLAHHAARLAGVRELIAARPRTPWQLAEAMDWNRPWRELSPRSRTIAVAEAEAHLRRLTKAGSAEAVPGSDPVAYQAL